MARREIFVYADWHEGKKPSLMGILSSELLRGKEIFSFEYTKEWLSSGIGQNIDPDLQFFLGKQYLNDQHKFNFGMFLDSSPDRWGRVLMQRREAAEARRHKRVANKLFETDYLLGVHDGHRLGGLRFKLAVDGPFLNDDLRQASPPWTSIPELEQISLMLENEGAIDHPQYLHWLNMLINPGSSLGGARPKASVLDSKNHLWIAKFPSRQDDEDIGAWEIATYYMAIAAGIQMSECQARKFSSTNHTFLAKRFDRTEGGNRVHFTSAMTQLGYTDGADAAAGVSYLELVDFITSNGANVLNDLHELWRRIVFSICISNTDDHLRNHGFLLSDKGWYLSPAYDLNPNENGTGLKLNISESDNALDLELAMEVHSYFRLGSKEAQEIIKTVRASVIKWREIASKIGISKSSQEIKSRAFQLVE